MKRAFFHFACAFLLVTAQLTALTHSVWHLHDYLPAHEHHDQTGAAHQHGDDETPSSQAELCVFHAAFGSLFAGGGSAQIAFAPADLSDPPAISTADWRFARSALTPPSRAPPVLL